MKIIKVTSLGIQDTYSPEMLSEQHNYIRNGVVHKNSHAVSYCLVAMRCLWLKAHFAPEWWAAVMNDCKRDKLIRYMGTARSEKWQPTPITQLGRNYADSDRFSILNIHNITTNYTVTGNTINQGINGIKGLGETAAKKYVGQFDFTHIDQFIEQKSGKDKMAMERFIKLGAFKNLQGHENTKALWIYYQYKHSDNTALKREVRTKLLERAGWNEQTIQEEINRQAGEYKKTYPKRNKIPATIKNWKPKPDDTFDNIMSLYDHDKYTLDEILQFEKEYLGYNLHNPLDAYETTGTRTIEAARNGSTRLEVVITSLEMAKTKNGKDYVRMIVNDGVQECLVFIWANELMQQADDILAVNVGASMRVEYDSQRGTFTLCRNEIIRPLQRRQ